MAETLPRPTFLGTLELALGLLDVDPVLRLNLNQGSCFQSIEGVYRISPFFQLIFLTLVNRMSFAQEMWITLVS